MEKRIIVTAEFPGYKAKARFKDDNSCERYLKAIKRMHRKEQAKYERVEDCKLSIQIEHENVG
jgi:hypothetical protein